jgi:hypothetical protein
MRQPAFAGIFAQHGVKVAITPGGDLIVERVFEGVLSMSGDSRPLTR